VAQDGRAQRWRSGARSDNARLAREVAVPPPSPVESPAEAVERAELRRMVVECVLALDEPYRSTVVLRFFEEQDVGAIARLTATGENTVRTRIRRGVLRVRELLECKVVERSRGTAHEGVAARASVRTSARDRGERRRSGEREAAVRQGHRRFPF
jgi:DNA-directed RNA polymerase specialized sigma24 family protein